MISIEPYIYTNFSITFDYDILTYQNYIIYYFLLDPMEKGYSK